MTLTKEEKGLLTMIGRFGNLNRYGGLMPCRLVEAWFEDTAEKLYLKGCVARVCIRPTAGLTTKGLALTDKGRELLSDN